MIDSFENCLTKSTSRVNSRTPSYQFRRDQPEWGVGVMWRWTLYCIQIFKRHYLLKIATNRKPRGSSHSDQRENILRMDFSGNSHSFDTFSAYCDEAQIPYQIFASWMSKPWLKQSIAGFPRAKAIWSCTFILKCSFKFCQTYFICSFSSWDLEYATQTCRMTF